MPWNEPGGNGSNQDPWSGKKEQGPPDLDKLITDFIKKLRLLFRSKKGSMNNWQSPMNLEIGFVAGLIAVIVLIAWFIAGLFIVNPAEEAVILRFGKYIDVVPPGLHWVARFIDSKYLVDVQKIYSFALEGDFLTKSADQNDLPNQYIQLNLANKASGSSDQSKNLVNVELNVQYRISDARAYLFNMVNPDDTIKGVAASALSDVIGKMKLDDVLTIGRENLSLGVFNYVKQVLASYNTGLEVIGVTLRKVQSPDQVRAAFNDVNRAEQDKATYIQQAQAYASKVVPLAQGVSARILADANAYRQKIVLVAQANVASYQALLNVYTSAPEITRERMYLEAMQSVLQNTTKVLVDGNSSNNLIYLPLDKLVKADEPTTTTNEDVKLTIPPVLSPLTTQQHDGEVKNDTN